MIFLGIDKTALYNKGCKVCIRKSKVAEITSSIDWNGCGKTTHGARVTIDHEY